MHGAGGRLARAVRVGARGPIGEALGMDAYRGGGAGSGQMRTGLLGERERYSR